MSEISKEQAYKMLEILAEIYGRQHNCEVVIVEKETPKTASR